MILGLNGHLGTRISALVDGQLSADEEERAWQHVLACPGCRSQVEREGWLKTQLSTLSAPAEADPPSELIGSLCAVTAWADVDALERRGRARRASLALGAGSVSAAVFGIMALTGAPAGLNEPAPSRVPANVGTGAGASVGPTLAPVLQTRRQGQRIRQFDPGPEQGDLLTSPMNANVDRRAE